MPLSKGKRRNFNNHVLHSGYKGTADYYEKYETTRLRKEAIGRRFDLVGSHLYRGVSEQDVELRQEYIKSLISNYTNNSTRRIALTLVSSSYDLTRKTEVYKVSIGSRGWGKVVVSVIGFDSKDLQFAMFQRADGKGKYKSTAKEKTRWGK